MSAPASGTRRSTRKAKPRPPTPPRPSAALQALVNEEEHNSSNVNINLTGLNLLNRKNTPQRKLSFEYDPSWFNKEDNCIENPKSDFCKDIVSRSLANNGLIRLEIPDDGNCFFYSLRAWILLNNYPGLATDGTELLKMKPGDLRKFVVSYGQANTNTLRPFYTFNDNTLTDAQKDSEIKSALAGLKKDKAWALGAGDYLPNIAAEALQLNLHIYNWTWRTKDFGDFYEYPIIINPDLPIVPILRINNNHYDLLFPASNATEGIIRRFNAIKKSIKTMGGRRTRRNRNRNRNLSRS